MNGSKKASITLSKSEFSRLLGIAPNSFRYRMHRILEKEGVTVPLYQHLLKIDRGKYARIRVFNITQTDILLTYFGLTLD